MIIGLGSDLCDIRRLEKVLARFEARFVERCFTDVERRRSDAKPGRAASYAKRFAAKEACAKALGTGFNRGVFMSDLSVVNLPGGQPTLHLSGGAATRLAELLPAGASPRVALTMTDEYPYAYAQVIISAVPRDA